MINGTTEECLKHYFRHYGDRDRMILGRFAKVSAHTMYRWSKNRNLPEGETKLRLRVYLSLVGYQPTEWEDSGPMLTNAAQCFVFELITMQMFIDAMKLPDASTFLKFYRAPGMIESRSKALAELVAKHDEARKVCFEKHREELLRKLKIRIKSPHQIIQGHVPAGTQVLNDLQDVESIIEGFISACTTVRTLAEKLLSGSVDARIEMRRRMRQSGKPMLHVTWDIIEKLLKEKGIKSE